MDPMILGNDTEAAGCLSITSFSRMLIYLTIQKHFGPLRCREESLKYGERSWLQKHQNQMEFSEFCFVCTLVSGEEK